MAQLRVRLTGNTPLIMHNGRLANPFDKYTQRLSDLTKEKKRKGVDKMMMLREMAKVEWEGGLYHGETDTVPSAIGPYIPGAMIHACICEGAKISRGGRTVTRAVVIPAEKVALQYDGPRTLDKLRDNPAYEDQRMVKIGASKVLRTRPVFPSGWSLEFDVLFNPEVIDETDLLKYIADGGNFEGLGDGRSKGFGRFQTALVEEGVVRQAA